MIERDEIQAIMAAERGDIEPADEIFERARPAPAAEALVSEPPRGPRQSRRRPP